MSTAPASPHSLASERAIIAAVADNGPDALALALESRISHASFYDPAHGRVFAEVLAMHSEGKPLAVDTLAERLRDRGVLDQVGSWPAFAEMTANPPLTSELRAHCAEVAALETRRRVISGCVALAEAAASDPDAMPEAVARLLETQTHAGRSRTWHRVVADAGQRAQDAIAGRQPANGAPLSFGFADLDRIFRAMARGELVIISASTSCGKSSFMREICASNARQGRHVLIESLEVSADSIADALAATASGVPRRDLHLAPLRQQQEFLAAVRALDRLPLHVFDCDRSLGAIVARAKSVHAVRPLDLVAVDYLGLISDCAQTRTENKTSAIGRVTKALKSLAMELGCVVILLAQVNRESAKDGNREPRLADLRDSGEIEQDGDRVIFIHRPEVDPLNRQSQRDTDDADKRPRFFANLIQAKGRDVGTGIVSFYFRRDLTRFEQIAAPAHEGTESF